MFVATGIRQIDFKNPDYAWDAPKLGAPETWKSPSVKPRSIARVAGCRGGLSSSSRNPIGHVLTI
jgi:hypothetical protein